MSDYYKGKLRVIDLDKLLAEPPDPRPTFCPTCCGPVVAGWCGDCGFDWCDGCAAELRAANPHQYGTPSDCEAKLIELNTRFHNGDRDPRIQAQYVEIHRHWVTNR